MLQKAIPTCSRNQSICRTNILYRLSKESAQPVSFTEYGLRRKGSGIMKIPFRQALSAATLYGQLLYIHEDTIVEFMVEVATHLVNA